ncbi:hypothetical protein BB558_001813 [Smittium angustum]|uniref:Swiss Army Knife RNA repair protein HAD domain-containing protein n=1 Tax=Smittium angustum TaxID=133377 RepID=A0A2U1JAC8_SMIAN|nr:hypothetical protein BB558_001813 [Smittium angustum]
MEKMGNYQTQPDSTNIPEDKCKNSGIQFEHIDGRSFADFYDNFKSLNKQTAEESVHEHHYQQEINNLLLKFDENNHENKNGNFKNKKDLARLVVIDFDNTLFRSPLPNSHIWDPRAVGFLKGDLGWFLESRTLQKPYLSNVESRWIREVEEISLREINRPDTISVLLTGRSDYIYHDIIGELLVERGLKFDLVILKENPNVKWKFKKGSFVSDSSTSDTQLGLSSTKVFEAKATNLSTFDYKMQVIDDIIKTFPTINSIYMWDDRINHCSKMQDYLEKKYVETKTIKEGIVYKVDQHTLYMEEELERELVKSMIENHNNNIALEHYDCFNLENSSNSSCSIITQIIKKKVDTIVIDNETTKVPVTSAATSENLVPFDITNQNLITNPVLASKQLKLHPIVFYTGVVLDQHSQNLINSIFNTPPHWRKPVFDMSLGIGLVDPGLIGRRLGHYNDEYQNYLDADQDVVMDNGEPFYGHLPSRLISYGDTVDIRVDGIGFIPNKMYGLRVSRTVTYPGTRNTKERESGINNGHVQKRAKRRFVTKNFHSSGLVSVTENKPEHNNDNEYVNARRKTYHSFIVLAYNEAGGTHMREISTINTFIKFNNITKKTLHSLDSEFGTNMTDLIDLDQLTRAVSVRSDSRNNRFLEFSVSGSIEPITRVTVAPLDKKYGPNGEITEKRVKLPVSIGRLIIEFWGDKISNMGIGKGIKFIEKQMEESGIKNSLEDKEKIENLVSKLEPTDFN